MQEPAHRWREAPRHLPVDAPSILVGMLADAGFGQPSTFGGELHTNLKNPQSEYPTNDEKRIQSQ